MSPSVRRRQGPCDLLQPLGEHPRIGAPFEQLSSLGEAGAAGLGSLQAAPNGCEQEQSLCDEQRLAERSQACQPAVEGLLRPVDVRKRQHRPVGHVGHSCCEEVRRAVRRIARRQRVAREESGELGVVRGECDVGQDRISLRGVEPLAELGRRGHGSAQ